ncbi:Casein kinase I 1 [Mycena kentingensis (nom. inval.)]|nr:Casein kinase I 1 [Mycena kentingensis (nom. inval.)]
MPSETCPLPLDDPLPNPQRKLYCASCNSQVDSDTPQPPDAPVCAQCRAHVLAAITATLLPCNTREPPPRRHRPVDEPPVVVSVVPSLPSSPTPSYRPPPPAIYTKPFPQPEVRPSAPQRGQYAIKGDPLADITRLRVRTQSHHCLYPGATFQGTQKSGRNSYDVNVTIVDVDFASSFLCGYLRIRGLTDDWPELTTYFDAEIIGSRYGFLTQNWGATEQADMVHWSRFPAFRHVKSELKKPHLTMPDRDRGAVFMRWKERFLVPDHRVQDINGASFAGFYYVCVDFNPAPTQSEPDEDETVDEARSSPPTKTRRDSSVRRTMSSGVHYKVGRKIGEGSFGVIFEGTNLLNSQTVAIKFEPRKAEAPQLRDECRSYRILAGCVGIPQIYHFGQEGLHNILVIDLLGPSLEDLFDMCGRKFSIKTVCMAARQMLSRVQTIHEKNLIYRDIKPDNFLIGRPGTKGANVVHVVDFGMAKQYRDPKTKQHIPYRERKSLSGTARYMSINTHLGREQSRRDDLEALGHVFMYFLRGSLPWQGLKAATNKQKSSAMAFPAKEFGIYLNYVRKLGFEETPDYDFLRELFTKVMKNNNDVDDGVFDWNLLNGGKGWEASMGQSQILSQIQSSGLVPGDQRRRGDTDRRRASQAGNIVPPSPALVRHGSKQRKVPNALTPGNGNSPGQLTPHSAAAQVNVPVGARGGQHPYANASNGGYDYAAEDYAGQQPYGRASPMVSSVGGGAAASGDQQRPCTRRRRRRVKRRTVQWPRRRAAEKRSIKDL